MPLVGVNHGSIGNDLANESGSDIDNGNEISLKQLLMNLATSGNQKHVKLASDLLELDLIQDNLGLDDSNEQELTLDNNVKSDNLGPDCLDKSSLSENESDMDWTTVRHKNKRSRSGSNDFEKTNLDVSPNKKSKKSSVTTDNGQKLETKSDRKPRNSDRNELNKDSVLVVVTEIPDDTYFNAIKMENMILKAFPRLKETGMWTKYRINKRHKTKCYVTLPKDHFEENVTKVIKSQIGFESCKVKVIKGINDVPEKRHRVVAIGVHQTISEDDIKSELAKSNIKIIQVQRLKFNGQPTRKVVVEFDNEQDMKIALFNGIYFGRIRVRCESYRATPPVTQCYKCQGFNHIAKDCKNDQKCVRCAGAHKSTDCPDKNKETLKIKCSNCHGNHVASFRECQKFKDQIKIQADKAKVRQEKLQNNLVVRGITFSNMVQNKTEKVQSELTEKIQVNKRETEVELDNIVHKLETKMEEAFKALSEKVVSFMVNSMVEIYDKLDRKNADKVYSILSKESVECFSIQLNPISPPLSPPTSVETSVSQVDISKAQNKPKKPPITQKLAAPRSRKPQNGSKK